MEQNEKEQVRHVMNEALLSTPPFTKSGDPALPFVGAHRDACGVFFRVWAPGHESVRVVYSTNSATRPGISLEHEADGYFSGRDPDGRAGDQYMFSLDGRTLAPDPASRFQPSGVFGPSEVVRSGYTWAADDWHRPPLLGRVIYELHIGTFSPEGTFRGAISRLDHISALGANTIELMPLADFPGRWNWGYDGVMLYAPARCYGEPDDLRALIDAAHQRGLAVILDVVYNHLGPVGNHLGIFSDHYFHPNRQNLWGRALNFDGDQSRPVRDFFVQNALYWLDEFRIDGLRLDATHAIEDRSAHHLMAELGEAAHTRSAFLIAENEYNDAGVVSMFGETAWGLDGVWADDFHHTVRVALTGQTESHFGSYKGTADEWVDTLLHGWLYRGQYFPHWQKARGTEAGHLAPEQFIFCISNHDQVGNRALGDRLHHGISDAAYRAVSMLLCLTPYTPMIFMGQEWAASSPFLFFTDHPGELGEGMAQRRIEEFEKFGANTDPEILRQMPDPQTESSFTRSRLHWAEAEHRPHSQVLTLYRECLALRRTETIFQNPPRSTWGVRRVEPELLGLRWRDERGDWLLIVGLHLDATVPLALDPFLLAGEGRRWRLMLSSNDERFGGSAPDSTLDGEAAHLRFSGPAAFLLREVAVS